MARWVRWALAGSLPPVIVGTVAGCALGGLLLAASLIDQVINRNPSDHTTRLLYRVESSGAGNAPIVGADIQLFALRFSGDPNNPADYESTADAHRVTNTSGEAEVIVAVSPQQTEDNIIKPLTYYREVVVASGFATYTGVRSPLEENQGPQDVPIRLIPLGP